jgi:hypothetical protein
LCCMQELKTLFFKTKLFVNFSFFFTEHVVNHFRESYSSLMVISLKQIGWLDLTIRNIPRIQKSNFASCRCFGS